MSDEEHPCLHIELPNTDYDKKLYKNTLFGKPVKKDLFQRSQEKLDDNFASVRIVLSSETNVINDFISRFFISYFSSVFNTIKITYLPQYSCEPCIGHLFF